MSNPSSYKKLSKSKSKPQPSKSPINKAKKHKTSKPPNHRWRVAESAKVKIPKKIKMMMISKEFKTPSEKSQSSGTPSLKSKRKAIFKTIFLSRKSDEEPTGPYVNLKWNMEDC